MTKNTGGRPPVITPAVLQKLETAFSSSCTDAEACIFAGIGESTLYDYCKKNRKFSERKELIKKTPSMISKMNIVSQIANKKNAELSKWWLECRNKDEFSKQIDHGATKELREIILKYVN